MKSWNKKVLAGMKLIKEECQENPFWANCNHCPFNDVCDIIQQFRGEQMEYADYDNIPSEWFEEEKPS